MTITERKHRAIKSSDHTHASFHHLPRLPHRDPFDRMLVWLAIQRDLVLITKDSALPDYRTSGIKTLW